MPWAPLVWQNLIYVLRTNLTSENHFPYQYTVKKLSISKKDAMQTLPPAHCISTAHHHYDRRTTKDFNKLCNVLGGWTNFPRRSSALEEPSFLSIPSTYKTKCFVRIKFPMALPGKQAQNGLDKTSCFETELKLWLPNLISTKHTISS